LHHIFFFEIFVQKKTYNINHCVGIIKEINFFHVGHCTTNVLNPMPHLICYYLVFAQQVGFHLLAYTNRPFHRGFTLILKTQLKITKLGLNWWDLMHHESTMKNCIC